jgi:hypothetical protein
MFGRLAMRAIDAASDIGIPISDPAADLRVLKHMQLTDNSP